MERMSVIEKGDTKILLMDQTRIVVPLTMRKKLLEREHLAHSGVTKMSNSIRAKYFRPGIVADVKRMVEACEPCQLHQRAQRREPNRPALEHVSQPINAIGINFFERHGCKYLLHMDHFSGLPMYTNMGYGKDTDHTVRQLKRLFATFGLSRSIIWDNGPPYFSKGFKEFCDKYCIELILTSPYNPENLGAAERGVSLIKAIMPKTEQKGSCFEEAGEGGGGGDGEGQGQCHGRKQGAEG